jgi:hypothetical protein
MKINPEMIRALTPISLALIGGAIGIAVLAMNKVGDKVDPAGFGLASTAIAGAAGLAQSKGLNGEDE